MSKDPFVERMESDMKDHGEVHVVFEEHDAEVELRSGTTEFDYSTNSICVESPDGHYHVFGMDRVVSWYKPMSVFHH